MMIEQHYDEEVLAEFLAEPADAVSRDQHLATCDLCLRTLDSLRTTAQVLTEPAVWDTTPVSTTPRPETLAFLRGLQKSTLDEDAQAAFWIKQLLAGPRETWAPRLEEHPEWRTGGMVRALLRAGDEVLNTVPADAVEITRLAAYIAEKISAQSSSNRQLLHLLGLAHYDHAYALWDTGALGESLEALDRADEYLEAVATAAFDQARSKLVRAMLYNVRERRDEALRLADTAAATFARYSDHDRVAACRTVMAITLQSAMRFRDAAAIHEELAAATNISESRRINALHNMALCYQEIGDFRKAADCLVQSIAGYERLGMMTFRSKSRWALAQLLMQQARHDQAYGLLRELLDEFQELEMASDVAMVSLDIAESLLVLNREAEIDQVCRNSVAYFAKVGMAATEPALRGLAYLRQAATAGRLTRDAVKEVRAFLLAPTSEPKLLFLEESA